ncbi:MAG: hypothetical protein ACI9WU_003424 [Myxococcota bacterium]|jgi:hypothetical protein
MKTLSNRLALTCLIALTITPTLISGCAGAEEPTPGLVGGIEADSPETADDDQSALVEAVPGDDLLDLALPAAASKPGTQQGALVGETSGFWAHTAGTAFRLKTGLAHILLPLRWVVNHFQPRFQGRDKAVWMGSSPLDPQQHLLVVRRRAANVYRYALLARLKSEAGNPAAWRLRIVGQSVGGIERHGSVWVNLDNDLDANSEGKVLAHWTRNRAEGTRTISAFFFGWSDGSEAPIDMAAHFAEENDGSGLLVHAVPDYDFNQGEAGKEALEDAVLISRWNHTGAGRGDLVAAGGDVAAEGLEAAAVTQCWVPNTFISIFEAVTVKAPNSAPIVLKTWGDFGQCAFADAAEPSLPQAAEPVAEADDVPEEAMIY